MATKKKAAPVSTAARDLVTAMQKKYGKVAVTNISDEKKAAGQVREHISSGIDVLDWHVLGRGGWPIGRASEVYGAEGSCKTSLQYLGFAQAQKAGGVAAMVDAEHTFDEERAALFGVNLDDLIVLQPDHLEHHFGMLKMLLKAHDAKSGPLLIGWDTVASTQTKSATEADEGKSQMGKKAGVISQQLSLILDLLPAARAHLMMLNQQRVKFGVMFGDNTTTPGGNAPKFYASTRLAILGGKGIKDSAGDHTGKVVTMIAMKNREAPPFRKARVRLDYLRGFNNIYSTIELAKTLKLITPREDGYKGAGKAGLMAYSTALEALGWDEVVSIPEPVEATEVDEVEDQEGDDESDE